MATSSDLEAAVTSVVGQGKMAQPYFGPNEDVSPPYVHLMPDTASRVSASDRTWIWLVPYDVILCTAQRDRALERSMAAALDAAHIGFTLSFSYDVDERLFMAIFSTDEVAESEE